MSDTIQRLFREDLDKARREAREQGRAEGRAEGRQETVSLIVRNLLGLKVPHDRIAQITGLSLAEVKTLAVTS